MRRIAVLLASMLFTTLAIAPVVAHADLESMSPEPGSSVTEPLALVTLKFGEEIRTLGSVAVIIDPTGNEVPTSTIVQGQTVTLTIADAAVWVNGDYHVNFRVDSVDGHIVEGSEIFTYNGPVASETPLVVATLAADEDGEGSEGGAMLGLGLLAVVVIGGVVYAMNRRK